MAEQVTVKAEDVAPVRARVNWGAILAGAVLALAVYLVLTLLGAAIGLSVGDNFRPQTVQVTGAIWAVFTLAVSLFVGGWATTQLAVGETQLEAGIHGVIMWGVVFAIMLWTITLGVRSGFNALVGMAYVTEKLNQPVDARAWEELARRAGASQEQVTQWREQIDSAAARAADRAEDPEERQAAVRAASHVAWWTLLGTVLSIAAAVAGALVGCGPAYRLVILQNRTLGRVANTPQPTSV